MHQFLGTLIRYTLSESDLTIKCSFQLRVSEKRAVPSTKTSSLVCYSAVALCICIMQAGLQTPEMVGCAVLTYLGRLHRTKKNSCFCSLVKLKSLPKLASQPSVPGDCRLVYTERLPRTRERKLVLVLCVCCVLSRACVNNFSHGRDTFRTGIHAEVGGSGHIGLEIELIIIPWEV